MLSDTIIISANMPANVVQQYGAPEQLIIQYELPTVDSRRIEIKVFVNNKTATKLPEAGYLSFNPPVSGNSSDWNMKKLVRALSLHLHMFNNCRGEIST